METKPWPECSIIKRSPVIFSSISLEITTNIKAWRISKPNIFKFSILSFRFVETMKKKTTPQIGINVRQLKATLPWPLKFIVQKLQESYNKYSWESWRYASIRPRLNTRLDEKEGHGGRVSFFPSSRKHGDGKMTFYSRCSEITNIIDRIISTIRCILIIEFHLHNQF